MLAKFKNAIIFISILVVLVLAYFYFIRGEPEPENLVSTSGPVPLGDSTVPAEALDKDFLPLLLNVKNIRLNDSIFNDPAFMSLVDSSIVLTQDSVEGRPNPFAPLGSENALSSPGSSSSSN